MIELKTTNGTIKWKAGKHLKGDEAALEIFRQARPGEFGQAPGVTFGLAHRRRDSFLHLAQTIWPNFEVVKDTEPLA